MAGARVLTINSGSSSLKFALFEMGEGERRLRHGLIERIGLGRGRFRAADEAGATVVQQEVAVPDHAAALETLLSWLQEQEVAAVGHRVVHGGPKHLHPEPVTPELLALLRDLIPLAPDHLPQEIAAMEALLRSYPQARQVACFDTSFHRCMPRLAQLYGLPRALAEEGVLRYGFHGLSCEYLIGELQAQAGEAARGRVVIAHLGNGASMVALREACSVEVSMGFTPTSGLVMSTRCGDIDPSIVLYLIEARGMTPAEVRELLNRRSGLLGVSGETSDMKDLLAREATDPQAAEAVALFCYQARKYLGELVAVLGGLDTLIFSGGIGEHARPIRARICEGFAYLGVALDADRNAVDAPVISVEGAPVTVRVMPTDEERMIARHTYRVLGEGRG